jgi:hypothetical protein
MKTLSALFLVLLMNTSIFAQTVDKSNTAVCWFLVTMDESFGIANTQPLYDSVYKEVATALSTEGYSIKDLNVLQNTVMYNKLDYPMGSGKRAAKSNAASTYLKIIVGISPAGFNTSKKTTITSGGIGGGQVKTNAKVKVTIDAVVYDGKGAKVKKVKVSATSADKVKITQDMFILGNSSLSRTNEQISDNQAFNAVVQDASKNLANALK